MTLFGEEHNVIRKKDLKARIRTAIAWGVPDQESIGYSATEFVNLLSEALREIERLERRLT